MAISIADSINCVGLPIIVETAFSVMNADKMVRRLQEDNGFQLHGILGTQFLKDNKWIIDFGKLEIIT